MDTGRLSQGQIIAAGSAAVLLVAMFLPWIGLDLPDAPAGVPVPEGLGDDSQNVWEGSSLDVYLLITGVVALVPALLALTSGAEEFSFASAATFLLGVVGVILVIVFLTVDFPDVDGAERKYGAFVGLAACVGIAYGGFKAMQEYVVE